MFDYPKDVKLKFTGFISIVELKKLWIYFLKPVLIVKITLKTKCDISYQVNDNSNHGYLGQRLRLRIVT